MLNAPKPNNFALLLPQIIQDNFQWQPALVDIKKLLKHDPGKLLEIPVSVDSYGNVVSRYRDLIWYLWPYNDGKSNLDRTSLDFSFLADAPELLSEIKAIFYLWMRVRGTSFRSGRIKVSTIESRLNVIKGTFGFLKNNGFKSVEALCKDTVWHKYKIFLEKSCLSKDRISRTLIILRYFNLNSEYLPFSFPLQKLDIESLSNELSSKCIGNTQSFAIPTRLTELIYGEALKIVETYWPHREKLSELFRSLRNNYLEAKKKVDTIIDSEIKPTNAHTKKITRESRDAHSPTYSLAIKHRMESFYQIYNKVLTPLGLMPEKTNDMWGDTLLNKLVTACYICTLGYSGIRRSESFHLTIDSYSVRKIDNKNIYTLSSYHHKLTDGPKHDEWVCSPGVGKAIELVDAITRCYREEILAAADYEAQRGNNGVADKLRRHAECLWLHVKARHKLPKVHSPGSIIGCLRLFVKKIGAIVRIDDLEEFKCINRNVAVDKFPKAGRLWPISSHQMRRTFAVFAARYNLASSPAIKQQFKHLYIQMTEYYGNGSSQARIKDAKLDIELMSLIEGSRIDCETDELFSLYASTEKLTGGKGKAIMIERQVSPYLFNDWNVIRDLIMRGKITYHSTGMAGCANGYLCEMESVSNPAYCVECQGAIITARHGMNWKQKHSAILTHLKQKVSINDVEFKHFITQIRAAEKVMIDLEIPFISYEPNMDYLQI